MINCGSQHPATNSINILVKVDAVAGVSHCNSSSFWWCDTIWASESELDSKSAAVSARRGSDTCDVSVWVNGENEIIGVPSVRRPRQIIGESNCGAAVARIDHSGLQTQSNLVGLSSVDGTHDVKDTSKGSTNWSVYNNEIVVSNDSTIRCSVCPCNIIVTECLILGAGKDGITKWCAQGRISDRNTESSVSITSTLVESGSCRSRSDSDLALISSKRHFDILHNFLVRSS